MTNTTHIPRPILVVGAGVIGLTTAIRLAQAGHPVTIAAKDVPSTIIDSDGKISGKGTYTSAGSGGLWMPVMLRGDVEKWGTTTYNEYKRVLETVDDDVGISMHEGLIVNAIEEPVLPWYDKLSEMRVITPKDDERIPSDYRAACIFRAPIIHMEVYLKHLESLVKELGIPIHTTEKQWTLKDARKFIAEELKHTDDDGSGMIIVNCTGIGAGAFYRDEDDDDGDGEEVVVLPGRGITVRATTPAGKEYFISEEVNDGFMSHDGLLAYAIPRGKKEYTLGGTYFKGDWSESATKEELSGIVERAARLLQIDAEEIEVVGSWTGLRPISGDGSAKVELHPGTRDVVDNYGHGGSGVTICWGCAEEVVEIITTLCGSDENCVTK